MKKVVTSILLIAACGASIAQSKDFTEAQKKKLSEAVKKELLDPESARFVFPPYKGGNFYCGQVNSKNRMGGYAGNAVFQVSVMPQEKGAMFFYVLGVGSADPENPTSSALLTTCAEQGYKIM